MYKRHRLSRCSLNENRKQGIKFSRGTEANVKRRASRANETSSKLLISDERRLIPERDVTYVDIINERAEKMRIKSRTGTKAGAFRNVSGTEFQNRTPIKRRERGKIRAGYAVRPRAVIVLREILAIFDASPLPRSVLPKDWYFINGTSH